MTNFSHLKIGEQARVVGFSSTTKAYRHKLLSLGLTRGVVFEVIRVAPLGDPVEIKVRGMHLSLRREEAAGLLVEKVSHAA
ncbi:MAG: ferrous iron transport protein A [Proteobacteria bacterium]|nr:ferrous iron transport protein A [Pseudomonadota bacterium]